jgi:hypothetical protein
MKSQKEKSGKKRFDFYLCITILEVNPTLQWVVIHEKEINPFNPISD